MTAISEAASQLQPLAAAGLLDVLEKLPCDVLRENVWLHLDAPSRCSWQPSATLGRAFRLSCHRGHRLSEQLIRRLHLTCSDPAASNAQAPGAFLARQEGLSDLVLDFRGEDGERRIVTALRRGSSACQRLSSLQLGVSAGPGFGQTTGEAVATVCPRITELVLNAHELTGAFFVPLRSLSGLTKVAINEAGPEELDCGGYLRALAALPALRCAELGGTLAAADVPLLAPLTRLRSLLMGGLSVRTTRGGGAAVGRALGGLTRLEELLLPAWESDDPLDCTEITNDLVAQLGGLQRLASLDLSNDDQDLDLTLSAASYDVLCRLLALTRLSCSRVARGAGEAAAAAAAPTGAAGSGDALLLLRHLNIWGQLSGRELAAMLSPLRPLPALRHAVLSVFLDYQPGAEDVVEEGEISAGDEVAVMWRTAALLGAAPRLEIIDLTICCLYEDSGPLSWSSATALLVPLRDRLTTLRLSLLPAGALEILWPLLCLAQRLQSLRVTHSFLPQSGLLLAVGQNLPALTYLSVEECDGVDGNSAVALAAVCVRPLEVWWSPQLDAEQCRAFRAVARVGVVIRSIAEELELMRAQAPQDPEL